MRDINKFYTIIVNLYNEANTNENYQKLAKAMLIEGFSNKVENLDGVSWALPSGVFAFNSGDDVNSKQLLDNVRNIINSSLQKVIDELPIPGTHYSILISGNIPREWDGLEKFST